MSAARNRTVGLWNTKNGAAKKAKNRNRTSSCGPGCETVWHARTLRPTGGAVEFTAPNSCRITFSWSVAGPTVFSLACSTKGRRPQRFHSHADAATAPDRRKGNCSFPETEPDSATHISAMPRQTSRINEDIAENRSADHPARPKDLPPNQSAGTPLAGLVQRKMVDIRSPVRNGPTGGDTAVSVSCHVRMISGPVLFRRHQPLPGNTSCSLS